MARADIKAAQDKHDVAIGWFADPIYLGRYPQSMIDRLGERLPKFTDDEINVVHGSSDFYGWSVSPAPPSVPLPPRASAHSAFQNPS